MVLKVSFLVARKLLLAGGSRKPGFGGIHGEKGGCLNDQIANMESRYVVKGDWKFLPPQKKISSQPMSGLITSPPNCESCLWRPAW